MERIYDEYVDKVYKFFYIKCLDRMTAEDLTSQTFIEFIDKSKSLTINDNKKYLYGIMRNIWINFLKDKYEKAIIDVEAIEDFEDYTNQNVLNFDEDSEPKNRLLPYIQKLPKKQREVLTMRLIEDKSPKEVASELGKDRNYVKTTHQRALKALREMLKKPYVEVQL